MRKHNNSLRLAQDVSVVSVRYEGFIASSGSYGSGGGAHYSIFVQKYCLCVHWAIVVRVYLPAWQSVWAQCYSPVGFMNISLLCGMVWAAWCILGCTLFSLQTQQQAVEVLMGPYWV